MFHFCVLFDLFAQYPMLSNGTRYFHILTIDWILYNLKEPLSILLRRVSVYVYFHLLHNPLLRIL